MKNKCYQTYYLFACLGVLAASSYPLYMGVKVIGDMLMHGTVMKEEYPKYIIPYTPICVAILAGILLMPLCLKLGKRFALLGGSAVSVAVFFAIEILFEQKVVVSTPETVTVTKLEDWQMYMCYMPADGWSEITTYKEQTPVDILMGNYNPAFKLHFYVISVILILSVLNALYGFAQMIRSGERRRLRSLILQSAASVLFLGLCILACFTAFWRDGNLEVSPISAVLMAIFFILLGMVGGIYIGSFFIGKRKIFSVGIPALVSAGLTLLMYVGEMILLHGHLYIYGSGFLFESIPGIVLSSVDLLIIFLSGGLTAFAFTCLNRKQS